VPRILDTYEAYHELLSPWPELEATLHITLPDLQGPLDIVEQLVGADLFIDMIERPELAARAFMRAAKLQVACARLFSPMTQDGPSGFTHQHGFLVKGDILIRDDSAVMISPELYRELVAPADEFVLRAMGGGGIHSCGRIWHAVPDMLALPSITSFDFGQSFMNDINGLYSLAKQKRIPFLRVQPTRKELLDGSILERFPTGVSLYYPAASAGEARELLKGYLRACVPGGKA